nr:hypothetical protein [Tanacetum cinerariifolium]
MNMGQDRQMQMVGGNGGNQFRQNVGNLNGYNAVQNVGNQVAQNPRVQNVGNQNGPIGVQGNGNQNQIGNGNLVAVRAEGNVAGHNRNQIRCYNCRGKEEAGIQLQAEEYDLMAAAADLDEIKEVNANCILMANLQQASSSGTQTDKALVYDSDGSAEYTELLKPIPEPQQVPQNDNNVISEVTDVEQAADLDEIEEVNANCILMANLQQASTSSTQTDRAPVYDSDGSTKVHEYENCYDNEIFNMFTQEEQYTKLLEPIP